MKKQRKNSKKQNSCCGCCKNIEKIDEQPKVVIEEDPRYNPSGKVVVKKNGKVVGYQG